MPYYVNFEEEIQLLSGSGSGEDLHGLITQASAFNTGYLLNKAGWTKLDIIARAVEQIRAAKEIPPTFVVLHPNDWWDMRLTKDSFGRYILGDPQTMVRPSIWGLDVSVTTSIAAGTFLVGSGLPVAAEIRDRMEMQIDISTEYSTYFVQNLWQYARKRVCSNCETSGQLYHGNSFRPHRKSSFSPSGFLVAWWSRTGVLDSGPDPPVSPVRGVFLSRGIWFRRPGRGAQRGPVFFLASPPGAPFTPRWRPGCLFLCLASSPQFRFLNWRCIMPSLGDLMVRIGTDTGDFNAGMDAASGKLSDFSDAAGNCG